MPIAKLLKVIEIYLIFAGILLIGTMGLSQIALADQVQLPAEKDNTIFEESGSDSCGACNTFYVGVNFDNQTRRSLIEFDVSSIPAGSTVTNVEFDFTVSRTSDFVLTPMDIHKANVEWGEAGSTAVGGGGGEGGGGPAAQGDATWTHSMFNTVGWTSGGDFTASPSASVNLSTTFPVNHTATSTPALVADVQGWVDDANTNHGWLLKLDPFDEGFTGTARAIDSRTTPSGTPPMLRVIFTPPVGDSDMDGVPDNTDNCINVANPNQSDSDTDGTGDACDTSTDVSSSIEIDDCIEFGGDVSISGGALMTFTSTGKAILPAGSNFNVSALSGALLTAGSSIHISNSVEC